MLQLAEYLPAALPPVGPDGAPPEGARKIGLAEAARRSGLSVVQLRRRCLEDWGPRGLAIQERPAEGGKPTWMVWDCADPSLSRVPASQRQDDLSDFTDAQRAQILERRTTLDAWQTAVDAAAVLGLNRDKATDQFLLVRASRGSDPVSRRTLYNWAQRDHRRNGLAVLADRRTVKNVSTHAPVRGRPGPTSAAASRPPVSTHAPVRGRPLLSKTTNNATWFQPTPP